MKDLFLNTTAFMSEGNSPFSNLFLIVQKWKWDSSIGNIKNSQFFFFYIFRTLPYAVPSPFLTNLYEGENADIVNPSQK